MVVPQVCPTDTFIFVVFWVEVLTKRLTSTIDDDALVVETLIPVGTELAIPFLPCHSTPLSELSVVGQTFGFH